MGTEVVLRRTISVCTPTYNEESNVAACYEAVRDLFAGPLEAYDYEHVFSDNASTDRTVALLRGLAADDPRVRVIVNSRNFGALRNTWNGMLAATGDAVVPMLPADLQDPPGKIVDFVHAWEAGNLVVFGVRAKRQENPVMALARRIYYAVVNRWSMYPITENAGEFQLLDRRVVEELRHFEDYYPYVRGLVAYCGFPSTTVEYEWVRRERGLSKASAVVLFDTGMNGIISSTVVPMRIALLLGTPIVVGSLAVAFVVLVMNVIWFRQLAPPGIPTLTIGLFFFSGVQLMFLGLLGEYVLAIHSQVRRKPVVIELERINFPEEAAAQAAGDGDYLLTGAGAGATAAGGSVGDRR